MKKERITFLENLPKNKMGRGISWQNSEGFSVNFIYDDW